MRRSWVEQVMGMPVSLLLRGPGVGAADEVVAEAYAEIRRIDTVFSTYREDSDVSRIRRGELAPGDAHPWVPQVLELCEAAKRDTDGWFDIDLPGGLDPSGLVKGWAVERTVDVLAQLADVDICVNAGGDVAVRVLPGHDPFVVGIEDPHDRTRVLAAVPLAAGGLATSGTAARGLHIVDPHTGRLADDIASLSVTGPSLMQADVLATAGFARGHGGLDWIGGLPSYEALVVGLDGRVQATAGWPKAP